jgi:Lipase (class 3)
MNGSSPTLRQIMVSLAYLTYCGELITTPSPEATILGFIKAAIPQIPPLLADGLAGWSIVWGPATYTTPGALYQDNMMFVAQNIADPSQLVVAVRGTNGTADLDWLTEDFDVRQMMPWPPGSAVTNPVGAMISESTSIDLQIVLSLTSALTGAGTLLEFLQSQASTPLNVCVTGHSLGGCLSTTLALYLKENQKSWDASGQSIVSAISFAGPTAGNQAFATHSDSMFSGGPYPPGWDTSLHCTCDAVRCSLDIAPLVWDSNNVSVNTPNLITLYGSNIEFHGLEWDLIHSHVVTLLTNLLAQQGYRQIEATEAPLPGTFNGQGTDSISLPTLLEAYVTQALWQHVNSYPTLLGVLELLNSNIIVRS